jgi:hypothetical protein
MLIDVRTVSTLQVGCSQKATPQIHIAKACCKAINHELSAVWEKQKSHAPKTIALLN